MIDSFNGIGFADFGVTLVISNLSLTKVLNQILVKLRIKLGSLGK